MLKVAEFLHQAVQTSLVLQKEAGSKLLKDFVRVATEGQGEGKKQLEALAKNVQAFATSFPLPGITVSHRFFFNRACLEFSKGLLIIRTPRSYESHR